MVDKYTAPISKEDREALMLDGRTYVLLFEHVTNTENMLNEMNNKLDNILKALSVPQQLMIDNVE